MSSFSFPFPTNGTDNQVTAEMAREFNAALFTNGILEDFVLASQANSVLQFSAGQCIIDGAFYSVDSGVSIDLSAHTESTLYIVVRMDVSNRTSTMIATETLSDLDNLRDVVVGIATLTASGYAFSNANKSAYSTTKHVNGNSILDTTVTANKLAGAIPQSKMALKVSYGYLLFTSIPERMEYAKQSITASAHGMTTIQAVALLPNTADIQFIAPSGAGGLSTVPIWACKMPNGTTKSAMCWYVVIGN